MHVLDETLWRRYMMEHGGSAGVPEATLRRYGVETWKSEPATGDLKGTLIARSWEGGALCAYVSCGESLYRVPVWRGSDPYKRCVSMPLGSMVAMHVKAPAHGRPYCTSVEPIANRDDVPNEGGAYAHQCR